MTTDMIIPVALMGLVVLGSIALPFLSHFKQKRHYTSAQHAVETMQDKLNQIVGAVRDLDFDFDTGKITEKDYVEQRKLMIGRGVSLILQLRTLQYSTEDDEVEKLIASYRHQHAN